jgi:hypothetical protein
MAALFGVLGAICGLVTFVCWIMVLVKMFQNGQVGLGILSIFCGIVAFIMGWVKATEWNVKNVMMVWTGAIVGMAVFYTLAGIMGAGQMQIQ